MRTQRSTKPNGIHVYKSQHPSKEKEAESDAMIFCLPPPPHPLSLSPSPPPPPFSKLHGYEREHFFLLTIHLFHIAWKTGQGLYQLLTMIDAGGTRTCIHPHVSRPLYDFVTDTDN